MKERQNFKEIELEISTPKKYNFGYYKQKAEQVSLKLSVYKYWSSIYVHLYLIFSVITLGFNFILIYTKAKLLPNHLGLLQQTGANDIYITKEYIYVLILIPFIEFFITTVISSRSFNSKKYISYLVMVVCSISLGLFLVEFIKLLQIYTS